MVFVPRPPLVFAARINVAFGMMKLPLPYDLLVRFSADIKAIYRCIISAESKFVNAIIVSAVK